MQPTTVVALLAATLLVVSAQTKRPAANSVAKPSAAAAAAQRRDITIENTNIGGDINLLDASTINISGSSIKGSITLQNGCRVQDEIVHECNGRRRRLNAVEKKKLRQRIVQIKKRQRAAKSGGTRKLAGKSTAARKTAAVNKPRAGDRRPLSAAAASKARSKAKAKAARTALTRRMNAGYTPCKSCPRDELPEPEIEPEEDPTIEIDDGFEGDDGYTPSYDDGYTPDSYDNYSTPSTPEDEDCEASGNCWGRKRVKGHHHKNKG